MLPVLPGSMAMLVLFSLTEGGSITVLSFIVSFIIKPFLINDKNQWHPGWIKTRDFKVPAP